MIGTTITVRMFGWAVDDITAAQPFTDVEFPAIVDRDPFDRWSDPLVHVEPQPLDGWQFREVIGGAGPQWHGFRDTRA